MSDYRAWLFKCNIDRYRFFEAVYNQGLAYESTWSMSQHWNDAQPGDSAALWVGGEDRSLRRYGATRGIYLLGIIAGEPEPWSGTPSPYWVDPKSGARERYRVPLEWTRNLLHYPITMAELDRVRALGHLIRRLRAPTRQPVGLTAAEWKAIEKLRR